MRHTTLGEPRRIGRDGVGTPVVVTNPISETQLVQHVYHGVGDEITRGNVTFGIQRDPDTDRFVAFVNVLGTDMRPVAL